MQTWTVIRFLHLAGVLVFVGGQLTLALAVAPAVRRAGVRPEVMRSVGKRFGVLSGAALALAVGTGVAMASHFDLWSDSLLQVKLILLALVGATVFIHAMEPQTRVVSWAGVVASLVIVWLGVKLTYG